MALVSNPDQFIAAGLHGSKIEPLKAIPSPGVETIYFTPLSHPNLIPGIIYQSV
jgi:hypothetical protein